MCNLFFVVVAPPRKTDKAQYTGCSVHENNNGQATFENPMYNTNTKAAEGKVVRFDPNLNTICTMVWCHWVWVKGRKRETLLIVCFIWVHIDVNISLFLMTYNKDTVGQKHKAHFQQHWTTVVIDRIQNLSSYWVRRRGAPRSSFGSVRGVLYTLWVLALWIKEPLAYRENRVFYAL